MNRLLLKECLDELRSDDLEELTEAHNHRSKHKKHPGRKRRQTQKKVGAGPNYAHRHSGSSKPTSRNQSNRKPTTGIDSKTGQELASLAETIAQEGAKSPEDFLNELSTRCGRPMAVADNSKYFTNTNTGVNLRLRLANHRGSAEWFFVNGHPRNNFGIVIKMEPKRFVPDKRVQYREEIFFKDDLDAEMEIGIVKGLMNWVATGRYNGPLGNETATSPDGRVVLNRRPRNRLAPNPQQPTTPPASPPTGPGVQESLAAKYFKEAHNMKYRPLIEAALRELMEESGFEEESPIGEEQVRKAVQTAVDVYNLRPVSTKEPQGVFAYWYCADKDFLDSEPFKVMEAFAKRFGDSLWGDMRTRDEIDFYVNDRLGMDCDVFKIRDPLAKFVDDCISDGGHESMEDRSNRLSDKWERKIQARARKGSLYPADDANWRDTAYPNR